ncbi:FAD-dependent monooxygenase [Caldimonas thermodepolymerans]|uniref:2-octaprenyl-6-methoxyphenol hydroxylase n=1 Tax=Caldimonas thermodepolymerans TaxID=215580 RepID=A0AA46HUR3_9BURK|nr:FAD-dependent monooxygenase [Caldimonas thermodepolymerans]TCP05041.1 2-octaprenyl-6-methoxyphenol hydroxylase [Caldimonas thermodepolymerans]UZG48413.1 FAD-dependent monooxygenase [Caldimonas thermodepolymerans]
MTRTDPTPSALRLAVVGAGPAGLALALLASRQLPGAHVAVFDARPVDADIGRDPRTLALSLGSVQLLQRLGCWPAASARPIRRVHVSQQQPTLLLPREPEVLIDAADEGVPLLGAVLSYGSLIAPLQQAWLETAAREPQRLATHFGQRVAALKPLEQGVEIDAGIVERYDLAVVAEGGVFAEQARKSLAHDYRQTAWVGQVDVEGLPADTAFERFTSHGPAALLPLPDGPQGPRAALVWCVPSDDDPVRELDDRQRIAVLNHVFHPSIGRITGISPLKAFALGLNAEATLVRGRTVRIGNAAQTLHPVAGQGLNLGLRDAFELVRLLAQGSGIDAALRRMERRRAPDRWATIATTDFLARSFTWQLPGLAAARGLGLAALQALGPAKSMLARQMMFGRR